MSNPYDQALGPGGSLFGVNLYTQPGIESQTFDTTQPAFFGSAVFDYSSTTLPVVGTVNDVVVGDGFSGTTGPTIGQYIVVPEPNDYTVLGGLGLVGFAGWRRWRHRA